MPSRSLRFSDLGVSSPVAFAHRGGAAYGPNVGVENTVEAFERAVGLGYAFLETDVHLSADGVIFATHDETLDRVSNGVGRIDETPAAEIERATVGGHARIPRMRDLLLRFPDARWNVDLKSDAVVDPMLALVEDAGAADRVCLASFSHRRLVRVRAAAPHLVTSASRREVALLRLAPTARAWAAVAGAGARAVQVPHRVGVMRVVTPGLVRRAHELDLAVHVWTVDDASEMNALLDLGVDGLITDRIDVLRDLLRKRGLWHDQRPDLEEPHES